MRQVSDSGDAQAEMIGIGEAPANDGNDRELLIPLVLDGEVVVDASANAGRAHHKRALSELPAEARRLSHGEPIIPTVYAQAPRVAVAR